MAFNRNTSIEDKYPTPKTAYKFDLKKKKGNPGDEDDDDGEEKESKKEMKKEKKAKMKK